MRHHANHFHVLTMEHRFCLATPTSLLPTLPRYLLHQLRQQHSVPRPPFRNEPGAPSVSYGATLKNEIDKRKEKKKRHLGANNASIPTPALQDAARRPDVPAHIPRQYCTTY